MLIYSEVQDEDDPKKPFMMKQEYSMSCTYICMFVYIFTP